jgi:hypothetical protein
LKSTVVLCQDFSQVHPSFDLHRVNSLELAMLSALKYIIRVSASEYAKYYFHLRSMMVRLGLQKTQPNRIQPLDVVGARKLQLSTEKYQERNTPRRRVQSVAIDAEKAKLFRQTSSEAYENVHNTVSLEQLVHAEHVDADGLSRLSKKQQQQVAASRSASTKSGQRSDAKGYK